jgi:predicted hydrolase (HD superfamily)
MAEVKPMREEAFVLLKEYNKSEGLIKHALAVEAVTIYDIRYTIYERRGRYRVGARFGL